MQLYLFGGYSVETESEHWQLILNCIKQIAPKQILFIGFAENRISLKDKFKRFSDRFISLSEIELVDASNNKLENLNNPLIYIGGGNDHYALYLGITQNPVLQNLVLNAEYYFGDSAGSMVAGSRQRSLGSKSPLMNGISILKDTIIEPHLLQKNRHQLLREEMESEKIKIGISLDEAVGIKINLTNYPDSWEKLGNYNVEMIKSELTK